MKDAKKFATVFMGISIVALALGLACAPSAPVVQGPVVSVDSDAKVIAVQDEANPEGAPIVIDISQAEIGSRPEVGDVVRLAYRTTAGKNLALRVMNLTQQKDRE